MAGQQSSLGFIVDALPACSGAGVVVAVVYRVHVCPGIPLFLPLDPFGLAGLLAWRIGPSGTEAGGT
jgi:hypothetical protein